MSVCNFPELQKITKFPFQKPSHWINLSPYRPLYSKCQSFLFPEISILVWINKPYPPKNQQKADYQYKDKRPEEVFTKSVWTANIVHQIRQKTGLLISCERGRNRRVGIEGGLCKNELKRISR